RLLLILFIVLALRPYPAAAQDDRYRVEVLVLTHLQHSEAPLEVDWPKNYSDSIDFLAPKEEPEEEPGEGPGDGADSSAGETAPEAPAPTVDAGPGEEPEPGLAGEEEEPPPLAVQVEEMSPVMQEAWRRLRLSGPFRPQQYLSWEQGGEPPFPLLRVHDQEVVMIDDPWADLRAAEAETPDATEASSPEAPDTQPTVDQDAPLAATEDEETALPDPVVYYRLDGTAQLRRSRFLHVDLDIALREPVFDEEASPRQFVPAAPPDSAEADVQPPPRPDSFRVYRLRQSRQVRTGRMEYFDSPVLGVLVYISGVEPAEDDPDTQEP
ncbi:MAG: CsiV family protein, partial [Lysobacterales bacterium]